MLEIIINKNKEQKEIALVENGKLVEYYLDEESIRNEGNIYIGIVKDIVKGMQSAFVNIGTEKNSFIHLKDILDKVDESKEHKEIKTDISKVIKKKKKIEDKKEQQRLKKLVKENLSTGNGAVIRTSAVGKESEIIEEIKSIEKKWNDIKNKFDNYKSNKPCILLKANNIVQKMIIDLPEDSIKKITVNDKKEYEKIVEIKDDNNYLKNMVVELKENEDVLDKYDLKKEIAKLENRKIWLKCGGFITIDKTEALTAIDVNTGKYTGTKNVEQTIYKVNEEATIEIARQLRLRDIGGIIIIDYIDMKSENNKEKIENLLKECLKKDRTKTQVEGFTKLDLMELTRKHICSHKE